MTDDLLQLDLTAAITDVPQANSLPLFIKTMEEIERGTRSVAQLADALAIEERTVHYYLDFGRWLGMLKPVQHGEVAFTEVGLAFATSVPGRGRLFSQSLFAKKLVQTINALKRESAQRDDIETLATREATEKAIASMTKLSQSTVERRASGLTQMLEAAYRASRIDWNTGEPLTEYRNVTFDFDGRTFLTAIAARQFASSREFRIGFPRQVLHFLEHKGHGLSGRVWKRASYDSSDATASWFGSIPVNETTLEIAERGGRDLRKLVTICAPYVTLMIAILTYRDAMKRPTVRLTRDMYGLKFWEHDREIGRPLEIVEKLAVAMQLAPVKGIPKALRHAPSELLEPCGESEMMQILEMTGIVSLRDTAYALQPGVQDELREGSDTSPSIMERLRPMHEAFQRLLLTERSDRA